MLHFYAESEDQLKHRSMVVTHQKFVEMYQICNWWIKILNQKDIITIGLMQQEVSYIGYILHKGIQQMSPPV